MKIIREITLDFARQGVQCTIPVTQNDVGILRLRIHLRNGSEPVHLSQGDMATLYIDTDAYDLVGVIYTDDSVFANTIEYELTGNVTLTVGEHRATLQVAGENGFASFPEFAFVVKESKGGESNVTNSAPWAAIIGIKTQVEESKIEFDQKKENALSEFETKKSDVLSAIEKVKNEFVVQEIGDFENKVISQKTVTSLLKQAFDISENLYNANDSNVFYGRIGQSGTIISDSTLLTTGFIPAKAGDTIYLKRRNQTTLQTVPLALRYFYEYDASKGTMKHNYGNDAGVFEVTGTNTAYVRLTFASEFESHDIFIGKSEDAEIKEYGKIVGFTDQFKQEIQNQIEESKETEETDGIVSATYDQGKFHVFCETNIDFEQGNVNSLGTEVDHENRIRSQYFRTENLLKARCEDSYCFYIKHYDENKKFVYDDSGTSYDGYTEKEFAFPSNVKFARFTLINQDQSKAITPTEGINFHLTANVVDEIVDAKIGDAFDSVDEIVETKNKFIGTLGNPAFYLDCEHGSAATWMGDKYITIGSTASDDLDTTTPAQITVWTFANGVDKPRTNRNTRYHKWGHANTIDYNQKHDALIMGNGSGAYDLEGKIFIIPNFSEVMAGTASTATGSYDDPFTLENVNAIVIDCAGYGLGTKFNVLWGENNGTKSNIAYLITAKMGSSYSAPDGGDNGTIRRLLLGMGSAALEYGTTINTDATDDEFNGTFAILDTYTQDGTAYAQCNQDSCFYRGEIFAAIGHDGIWLWKMRLNNGHINYDEYKQYTYNADGSKASTNISSCCIHDGYLYVAATNVGVMAFRI